MHLSFPYWDLKDPLWNDKSKPLPPNGNIVIVGGGDAGQQDLFRILTGKDPVEWVYQRIARRDKSFATLTVEAQKEIAPHCEDPEVPYTRRPGWYAKLRTMLDNDPALGKALSDLIDQHAPIQKGMESRGILIADASLNEKPAFALNLLLTLALERKVRPRELLEIGIAKDATSVSSSTALTATDCLGHLHTIQIGSRMTVEASRFYLRTGQDLPAPYAFGKPRWIVRRKVAQTATG
jgi:hypothetical protein